VKERLYVFLLQKREEAALSSAVMSDIAKVVDYAYTNPTPVSPKSRIVLLGSFLISLILPFGFLYIKFLLNTKINDKDEIKKLLPSLPIAGEIPLLNKNDETLIRKNSTDALAESFRILRTNLNFMGLNKNKSKVIFVTSTMKGEGKTFTSINLAATISTTRSKCLLIGADLRNPQIHSFLNIDKNRVGLSKYLYDDTTQLHELIINKPLPDFNLDVVLSGEIPPNPSELLVSDRFGEFLEEAKKEYEYIIVDTAPTILVTDTLLISRYADITLYTVRANYTDLQLLDHIREISDAKKLHNIGIVFNGVENNGAYAYNYGYGYGYQASTNSKRNRLKFW
jgi:capsular exopolysaccharide synthesis family protein